MFSAYEIDFRSEIGQPEYDFEREGIFIFAYNKMITFWSRGAQNITGYTAQEVENHKLYDLLLDPINKQGHAIDWIDELQEGRVKTEKEIPERIYISHRNGHRVAVSLKFQPILDHDGQCTNCVGIFCPYDRAFPLSPGRHRHPAWQRQALSAVNSANLQRGE